MSPSTKPAVVVIDDRIEDGNALRQAIDTEASLTVRTPDTFTKSDLRSADLVLVDYELSDWHGAGASLTSPPNGLALSAVVREQINQLKNPKVTGVALYSGRVGKISETLPAELRGFAVARLNNLEWVFEKGDTPRVAEGVVSLAGAIKQLPNVWPEDPKAATACLHQLLGLNKSTSFYETAADDISACHPPIHEFSTATHALAVIRWMAHRIVPYPTFLADHLGLAARLRIELLDLERLLKGKSKLALALDEVKYRGILCDLYGSHWWRSGVDNLLFRWTSGSGGIDAIHTAVRELAGKEVAFVDGDIVPGIDDTYRATELVSVRGAVRLRPDDWPTFADDAWAERDRVIESNRLIGLVVPADVELLGIDD